MKIATFVKQMEGFTGDARLYKLSEAAPVDGDEQGTTDYVVVSATVARYGGPETYIFPADEAGDVTSWLEMEGSFRGGLDHARALAGLGFVVE